MGKNKDDCIYDVSWEKKLYKGGYVKCYCNRSEGLRSVLIHEACPYGEAG